MNKNYRIFLEARSITLVAFFICVVTTGCVPSKVVVSLKKNNVVEPLSINISNVQVVNHQIIITGTNLNTVTNFKIKEGSSNTNLQIESKNNNSIVANTISNVTFAAGRVFDFILSNASGASTFTVDFSLCDSQLGGKGFNCSITPTDKQVLSYDLGTGKWRPRSVNGLNYQGTWSALTALPATGVLIPGDYYIVSVANAPYNVGDWIVLNADGITFEQIQNAAIVTTVFGRNGNVVATENDYILDKMGDVDLSTPPILGDALVYDGSHWVAGAVNGGGAPSGAAGGDLAGTYPNPTIGNNKITDAHIANSAISQTKINGLATSLTGKEPSITAAATTTYYRGDKTFVTLNSTVVPEGTNLYFTNARALGILLTGFDNTLTGQVAATDSMLQAFGRVQNQINSLSSGGSNYLIKNGPDTLSGAISLTNVITATGAGDVVVNSVPLTMTSAVNKTYADGKLDKTTGGVVAGVVTLDNDLKVKAGSNYVTVKGNAATAADYNFVLPVNAGTAGYLLSTDGAGNTSWITGGGGGAPTGAAGGDLSGNYPNPTITGLDAAKVGGGAVSNAEFAYLDGVTSAIQTQLNNKQGLDATLTALTAYNTNGFIVQTAVDTFAGRSVTGTSNRVSVTNGDGVAGNPSVNISTTLLPSPVVGDIGKILKATAADTSVWSTLGLSDITTALGFTPINKAGDSITSGIITLSGTAVLRAQDPVGLTDVANKQYVDSYGQWVKSGGDIYRSSGNVGVGTTGPGSELDVKGTLRLSGATSGYVGFAPAAVAGSTTYTLPSADGSAGQILRTNGSGVLSWATDNAGGGAFSGTANKAVATDAGGALTTVTTTATELGYVNGVTSAIQTQLNAKESSITAGTTAQYLRGDKSWQTLDTSIVPENTNLYFTNARSIASPLTGFATGANSTILATDTVLGAFQKTQGQIAAREPVITAGSATQYIKGDKSLGTFLTDVMNSLLTGVSFATNSAIVAGDNLIVALGKLQAQITGQATTLGTKADLTNIAQTITAAAVTGLNVPVAGSDAANKTYVDSQASPSNSIRIYQVRVATTGNITLSGTQTIDGVAVVVGNRVLVKNQTTRSQNGVYVVAAGAWARSSDLDTWSEAVGYNVQVSEGDSWDGMSFVSGATLSGTLGTTNFSWSAIGNSMNAENTVNGLQALDLNTTGYQNIASGHYSLTSNTTGYRNTGAGYNSLISNVVGNNNTATGYSALYSNTASNNTAHGSRSLSNNTTGDENTAIGLNSGAATTSGSFNLFAGAYSGESNTTGFENTFLGYISGQGNTTGYNNTTIGAYAGLSTTTGNRNTYVGTNAGDNNQTGNKNVALGASSLGFFNSTGDAFNTAVGYGALEGVSSTSTGLRNTAVGGLSGAGLTTGNNNLLIGYNSGSALTTGSNNVVIGSNTGSTIATLSNNILISDGAGTERARFNNSGFLGINTTTPGSSLDVKGTLRLSGSTSGYVGFAPAAAAGSTTYTLPSADGSSGQILRTNGSGVLSWVTDSTGGGAFSGTASRAVATDGAGALTTVTTTATELGYVNGVTSAIQTQLNGKEPTITAGTTAQYLRGDKSLSTFASDIWATVLTGLSTATSSTITAADSVLVAFGKLQAQISGQATTLGTKADLTNVTQTITALAVTGLSAPVAGSDAANKTYVDSMASPSNSIRIYKTRVATTGNITLSGTQTIDNVAVIAGDRVLVKTQSTPSQNGVYVVAAGAWTRASDMDTWAEVFGYRAVVLEGDAWGGISFTPVAYDNTGTIGVTNFDWIALGTSLITENTINGIMALDANTTGNYNIAIGGYSLLYNTDGYKNTAIGYSSLVQNISGFQNTAIGASALKVLTSGSSNIGVGYNSGSAITSGSNNVVIGSNTGSSIATLSNNILISDGAGTERARINNSGFLGINTTAPGSSLDVKGTIRLSGSTSGYVGFAPAAAAGSTTYTLPVADGSAGQLLKTNGAGVLSWVTDSTGAGAFSGTVSRAVATDGAGALTTVATTATELGYVNGVTSSIQTQLNAKEPTITAGTTAQYLRGDKSLSTFATDVRAAVLTGLSVATNSAIVAADTILAAFGKLQAQITSTASTVTGKADLTNIAQTITAAAVTGLNAPVAGSDAVNKTYVDNADALKVNKAGDTMTGILTLNNDLKIKGGANYVTLRGHASSANYNLILPSSAGTSGYLLSTDGSGNTSWVAGGGLTGSGTASTVPMFTSGTALGDSPITISSGKVRIGPAPTFSAFFSIKDPTPTVIIEDSNSVGVAAVGSISFRDSAGSEYGSFGDSNVGNSNIIVQASSGDLSLQTTSATPITFATSATERMRIDSAGNVGIGTTPTTAKLEVDGQIVSKGKTIASGGVVNFSTGNIQFLTSVGGATIALSNMVTGGQYTVGIEDTTARQYNFTGCGTTYFSPANGTTTQRTIYSILKSPTACYITWTTGFN